MSNPNRLVLGAVAYDPKVVAIWDGFQSYFAGKGLAFDYILYSNYERQVDAQFAGHIDVAWNSPLAWLQSERIAAALSRPAEAICMRDTDRDLTSVILVRSDREIHGIGDLKGKRVAVGARDSPQATLIPLSFIADQGLDPGTDFEVLYFDKLSGKHGDHIGGERDAARALMRGYAHAACMIDSNQLLFSREGIVPSGAARVLAQTPPYDHCNFTVLDGGTPHTRRFNELLLAMPYSDPEVKPLFDMEGLKLWQSGRTSGYRALSAALDRFGTVDEFVNTVASKCR